MDVRIAGAWVSPTTAEAYVSGQWRALRYGEAYYNGQWRQIVSFVQTLTLSLSPDPLGKGAQADTMTTAACTATPTGGLGPFTYAWTTVSSSGLSGVAINSPSASPTTFTATVTGGEGSTGTAVFRCTVTDSLGSTATDTVTVSFTHISSFGD